VVSERKQMRGDNVSRLFADDSGRYSYENQPAMCKWNCERLGEAWEPAMPGVDWQTIVDETFDPSFQSAYRSGFRAKVSESIERDACMLIVYVCSLG
jgi:uncharacterized protein YdiU (UPF0061 family)